MSNSLDDGDFEMESFNEEDHQLIIKSIETNPYDREAHLKFISFLRQSGDLEATRSARSHFVSLLAPNATDWINWIEEEFELIAEKDDKVRVKSLFEMALKDHPASIDLWSRYLNFCEENTDVIDDLETEYKKAAAFPAWNLSHGHLLLKNSNAAAHRAIPYTQKAKKAMNSEDLSVGLFDACEEEFPRNIDKYIQAVKASKLLPASSKLTLCRVLFERAIDDFNEAPFSLWEDYLKFLRAEMNVSSIVLAVNNRLIRAHPLNVNSWIILMENSELFNDQEMIEKVWNLLIPKILLSSSHENFLALQLAHLDSLRRSGGINQETILAFQTAIYDEEQHFSHLRRNEPADPQARLSRYFAQILLSVGEIEKFRSLWQQLLKEHAKEAAFWLEYLQMEKNVAFGSKSVEIILNGYKRAAAAVTDYPETIFYDWLQFERQHGTSLQTLLEARDRIDKQRTILREREQQRQQKDQQQRKRTRVEEQAAPAPPPVQVKPVKTFNPDATLFVNNLPFNFSEKDIENHFNSLASKLESNDSAQVKSIRMHMNPSGNSFKGHATIEFDSSQTSEQILKQFNRQPADESGRPVFLAKYSSPLELKKPESNKSESDAKTLFVSNLPFRETAKIEELFKPLQGIQQIRHVTGKQFAYIEFENENQAKEALKQIQEIDKTVKAAFSNPPTATATANKNTTPSPTATPISTTFLKPRSLAVKK